MKSSPPQLNVRFINPNNLSMNEDALADLLLYGDNILTDYRNTYLLNSVTEYIASTKTFDDPLILQSKKVIPLGDPWIKITI